MGPPDAIGRHRLSGSLVPTGIITGANVSADIAAVAYCRRCVFPGRGCGEVGGGHRECGCRGRRPTSGSGFAVAPGRAWGRSGFIFALDSVLGLGDPFARLAGVRGREHTKIPGHQEAE